MTRIDEEQIRVNVVPQKLKDGENTALTTPLTITDTAEELDRDLPETLVNFVSAHLELRNTLGRAKAEIDAAAKAAHDEARSKSKPTTKPAPKPETGRIAETAKLTVQPQPEPLKTASLFEASVPTPAPIDEEEELPEGNEENEEGDEGFDEAA